MSSFNNLVRGHQKRLVAEELQRLVGRHWRSDSESLLDMSWAESPVPSERKVNQIKQKNTEDQVPVDDLIYQVQCKFIHRYCKLDPSVAAAVVEGCVVILSAEMEGGLDVGVVVRIYSAQGFAKRLATTRPSNDKEEAEIRTILRVATTEDLASLPEKHQREERLLLQCQKQAKKVLALPIDVYGAEFQIDGEVLTFYYTSAVRADFRELVRVMYTISRVRIRMRKTNQCKKFVPIASASEVLRTGASTWL